MEVELSSLDINHPSSIANIQTQYLVRTEESINVLMLNLFMICSGIKENGVILWFSRIAPCFPLPLHVFLGSRKHTLDYEELERPLRQTKLSEVI